ncbi:MAG: beta-galactosidase [Bacteroidetes bacterium]|nr:MAG: beta-galactosidase [Bacteroidota bacterium]PTM14656.1 MAG: beta-galactosidase [Bacteroidota bacterium]
MNNKIFLGCLLVGLWGVMSSNNIGSLSQPLPRRIIKNISADWQYLENNLVDVRMLKDQNAWQNVDLPHTWNQWDVMDLLPGYRRDASWYQKEIFVTHYEQAHYLLYFEGANISSEIYVNGQLAGTHVGGYVGFKIDLTDLVKKGQKNTLSVRVDNSYNPAIIPSQKADFFIYGGLTRDVWLEILPALYLKNIAVSTPQVSAASAETSLQIQFNDPALLTADLTVKSSIIATASGKVVAEKTTSAQAASRGAWSLPTVVDPQLWSPDQPNLYTVVTQLLAGQQVIDEKTETIGYRWYHFEPHGAFFLNGQQLLLRGTHRHEEYAGYGAAMPNALHRQDMEQIKDMGANFVRLGHYPQDPEIYRACNELGLIVWDELPWCRGGMGEAEWQTNTERLLTEQIQQNYNHPSIIFWSVGNEIYWLPDFEDGDYEDRLNAYVTRLNNLAHRLDPQRLTAIRKYYAGADLVDVFSPSIWSGWYAGVYTNYQNTLTQNQEKYPQFLHMEYGGSSHVGRHTENPVTGEGSLNDDDWSEVANQVNIKNIAQSGDWTENYMVDLFDWYLGVSEQQPDFGGNAQWAFKDFGTPLRPENAIPYMNQKGLVDRAGQPKDAYYVYKSYWAKTPFTYIESHTWTERNGPPDKLRNICVFSNCEQVELVHNGKTLGTRDRVLGQFPACGLNWDVQFVEGNNLLLANGLKDGKIITTDTLTVAYRFTAPGQADHIALSSQRMPNGHYLIVATMQDKQGRRVLDYEKPVYFARDGAGELLKNYGTPTRSEVVQMANGRAAIELVPAAQGKAVIEVRNQDFKGSYLVIDFSEGAR